MQLSNIQQELLKIYSFNIPEQDLNDIKKILAEYFADKAVKTANEAWKEKGLTQKDMEKWLNEES
ncbi:MAG: hypothetical protein JXN64_07105 [Spirochaetes bacterium]|nr:hypothetical protein [Spirochaetota bacterium]